MGSVCFFGAKAFSISVIVIAKISCLYFLISLANRAAPIIQMSIVLSELRLSAVSYINSFSSVSGSVSDSGLGSLSILFIIEYQSFWCFYVIYLSFCLVWGGIVLKINSYGSADIPDF